MGSKGAIPDQAIRRWGELRPYLPVRPLSWFTVRAYRPVLATPAAAEAAGIASRAQILHAAAMAEETELESRVCLPCRGDVPALASEEVAVLLRQLGAPWRVVEGHHLEREFTFADFRSALEFTNRVGAVADDNDHHPDVLLQWGKVTIRLYTHKVDGLTEADFVLAAKLGRLDVA